MIKIKQKFKDTLRSFLKAFLKVRSFYIINKVKREKVSYKIRDKKKDDINIVVSLTSYDKRFKTLPLCLKSIINQTKKPDKIVLYLAEKDRCKLTEEIRGFQKYGIEIKFRNVDLKPHKKYYYAMKEYPNSIIITIDDDAIYDPHLIEQLLLTHYKFPRTIVAGRVRNIKMTTNGFLPYKEWNIPKIYNKPSMYFLATGVGGVLYPPHLLNNELLFNLDYIKEYIKVDDLWLKTIEILNSIPTVSCKPGVERRRVEISSAQEVGLSKVNFEQNENDNYWACLNKKFSLFDKLIDAK